MNNINRESFNYFINTNIYSNGKIDENKLENLNLKEYILDNKKYIIHTYPLNKELKNNYRSFCSFKESN